MSRCLIAVFCLMLSGCWFAPQGRLSFPRHAIRVAGDTTWYDVNHNARVDFATIRDADGRIHALSYDDNEDGHVDRTYRLSEYADDDVPHVILMLDSVPYRTVAERYAAGGLRMFGAPVKVVPPFPSITEVCYNDLLHGPTLPGINDEYYDARRGKANRGVRQRVLGYQTAWERRLHYTQKFYENALSFLRPRPWYFGELARARAVVDKSPDRVSLLYIGSASGMACKFGERGVQEILDGAEQFCLQLLHERHGAVKITLLADHGHNYTPSKNLDLAELLSDDGFRVTNRLKDPHDIVVELNGLVTYAGIYTKKPAEVAVALVKSPEVEFVMHLDGEHVLLMSSGGSGRIESSGGKVRYVPIAGDPLGYEPVLAQMRAAGTLDQEGFATDEAWLDATIDHDQPDAPRRIWDAFHRIAINTPDVLLTLKPGYCAGLTRYERRFKMASTHGSLEQDDSMTFVMTMQRDKLGPMRTREVLPAVEPDAVRPIINARPENKP